MQEFIAEAIPAAGAVVLCLVFYFAWKTTSSALGWGNDGSEKQ
jgi:hypothetical protein